MTTTRIKTAIAAALLLFAGAGALTPAAAADRGRVSAATPTADVVQVDHRNWRGHHRRGWDRRGWDQRGWDRRGTIDRRDVRRILAWNGYRRAHDIRRVGRTIRAEAISPRGRPVMVIMSARSGRILDTRRIHRGPRHHRGYRS